MYNDQSALMAGRVEDLRQEIVGIDKQVPLLDGSRRTYTYLDNAASTPTFRGVQRKVEEFLEWYSSVHRGSGYKSILSTKVYDQTRKIVADFVGADLQSHAVIFGKNTTEAINKLANRMDLSPDEVILTTVLEHHSNDLPWRPKAHVEYVDSLEDGSLDIEDLCRKLTAWRGRVRLVAITGASNVTGFVPPIYDIAELAHKHGAKILVDCAQLAPHRAVDMGPLDSPRHLDFVSISGHKMYAPFGVGALIGPKEFFVRGEPDYRGGGTVDIVTSESVYWTDPPERDEAGSPNVVGAVALAASIRILTAVGMDAVAVHEKKLTHYMLNKLGNLRGVKVFGSADPDRLDDRLGVIALSVDGMHHGKVAAILGFEGGIGVRNGCFCAHPYILRLLKVDEEDALIHQEEILGGDRSRLPGLVRISFGCYTTVDEIDHTIEMLARIVDGDYRGDYRQDRATGDFFPRGFVPSVVARDFSL
jgi:selenocysteine lyase/cysteine desulfurase